MSQSHYNLSATRLNLVKRLAILSPVMSERFVERYKLSTLKKKDKREEYRKNLDEEIKIILHTNKDRLDEYDAARLQPITIDTSEIEAEFAEDARKREIARLIKQQKRLEKRGPKGKEDISSLPAIFQREAEEALRPVGERLGGPIRSEQILRAPVQPQRYEYKPYPEVPYFNLPQTKIIERDRILRDPVSNRPVRRVTLFEQEGEEIPLVEIEGSVKPLFLGRTAKKIRRDEEEEIIRENARARRAHNLAIERGTKPQKTLQTKTIYEPKKKPIKKKIYRHRT